MEFKLQSAKYSYIDYVEQTLEAYPMLNNMDIRIETYLDYYKKERKMLFITLNSLEELMIFKSMLKKEIIIYGNETEYEGTEDNVPTLQIYDDYRE